ncbi:hypothetical protein [Arthrobacter sp. Br18]|uniref:hypothetical protein n=1 Tax=Arthrobacter sp. Br18 TaxID=1312954 RepID=UPI00047D9391|nr:hypothetical protein [Arthrobacter sp. Br18]
MSEALYALALLACPVGMGLMMWFMMRGSKAPPAQAAPTEAAELTKLRAEVDQLRASQNDTAGGTSLPQSTGSTLR